MTKYDIGGVEVIVFKNNINKDYLPVMQCGEQKITTLELKNSVGKVVGIIELLLKGGSIFDESLDKYNTALTVLKAIELMLSRKNNHHYRPAKKDIKIAMDVVAEIGLSQETNQEIRQAIKVTNFFAQAMMGD